MNDTVYKYKIEGLGSSGYHMVESIVKRKGAAISRMNKYFKRPYIVHARVLVKDGDGNYGTLLTERRK